MPGRRVVWAILSTLLCVEILHAEQLQKNTLPTIGMVSGLGCQTSAQVARYLELRAMLRGPGSALAAMEQVNREARARVCLDTQFVVKVPEKGLLPGKVVRRVEHPDRIEMIIEVTLINPDAKDPFQDQIPMYMSYTQVAPQI